MHITPNWCIIYNIKLNLEDLNVNVKKYREDSSITQKEMALKLNITQQAYSRKEKGLRGFTVEEALLLEEILGVSIKELFKKKK